MRIASLTPQCPERPRYPILESENPILFFCKTPGQRGCPLWGF